MGIEIERKFLVRDHVWTATTPGVAMRQGYLSSGGTATVRVRIEGDQARLTIKGPTVALSRAEYEYAIPVGDAEQMLSTLAGAVVEKIRYRVTVGAHVWEVDVFEGANAGLVLAEVELGAPDEWFDTPDWVGEEVSGDSRYRNSQLARAPWTTWGVRPQENR